jgi:endonuclease/exonuclease/phosphatase family metal-dependent hydrolase
MRFTRAFWLRAGTVAACAGALVATTAFASAATSGQAYLQFNMCGNICNQGGLSVVRNLERTITAVRPWAVTLNEVCENQYDSLRGRMPAYAGGFDATGPMCASGSRYGNAILVRAAGVDTLGSWPLPNPAGGETRRLMCVSVRRVAVCVTHIAPVPGNIAAQVDTVAAVLSGLGDRPVLLGGDFNTDPGDARLNPLYRTCYSPGTEHTFPKHKLDYVFLSRGHWADPRASTLDAANGLSDHRALLATAAPR